MTRHRVVIVGGGFGGLQAAVSLRYAPVDISLIDKRNFHLFQPLLYQVATGGLSPANIASPLRAVLARQQNVTTLLGEVTDFDLQQREVLLGDTRIAYDSLIVATGSGHHYFGNPQWERYAPGLKTIEDATRIRAKVLLAFEHAEANPDTITHQGMLTFVVVGGGPTGVELAGAIAELARQTLRRNFRRINPASARVLLLEAGDRVLSSFPPELSAKALKSLQRLGVTVLLDTSVTAIEADHVMIRQNGQTQRIDTPTVLWGAGVAASPLAKKLAERSGAETDRAGRIHVRPDCSLPGHPEVYCLGDMMHLEQEGQVLPGVAQVALQQGKFTARLIARRAEGRPVTDARFHYQNPGSMATIGRNAAVADIGWLHLSGYTAWLAWLFIHLIYLVEFENRILVFFQWAWNYFTRNRSARLITNELAEVQPQANKGLKPAP